MTSLIENDEQINMIKKNITGFIKILHEYGYYGIIDISDSECSIRDLVKFKNTLLNKILRHVASLNITSFNKYPHNGYSMLPSQSNSGFSFGQVPPFQSTSEFSFSLVPPSQLTS